MKRPGIATLVLAASAAAGLSHAPLLAQHMNDETGPCQAAGSMVDTSNCFDQAYSRADAELNTVYRRIMAVLSDDGKAKLKNAQRAWILYRDAACAAEAAPYQGGSAFGVARLACLEAATRQRTGFMKSGLWWRVEKFEQ